MADPSAYLVIPAVYLVARNIHNVIAVPCKEEHNAIARNNVVGQPLEVAQDVCAGGLLHDDVADADKFVAQNTHVRLPEGKVRADQQVEHVAHILPTARKRLQDLVRRVPNAHQQRLAAAQRRGIVGLRDDLEVVGGGRKRRAAAHRGRRWRPRQ